MPLPTPNPNEKEKDFISRCMDNKTAKDDFPDNKQRLAVCYDQWRKSKQKKDLADIHEVRFTLTGADIQLLPIEDREGEEDQKPIRVQGYAAVFYDGTPKTEYPLWPGTTERIMPEAFDRALSEGDDVRALFNHDANVLLGRTTAQTLILTKDKRGLRYEFDVDWRDSDHVKVARKIERGDLTGSSFSFKVRKGGQDWIEKGNNTYRQIRDVKPFDVGPVTFPAYEATQVALRSAEEAGVEEARQAWLDSLLEPIMRRARQVELDNAE